MTERTSPPVSLKSWREQVDRDPNIPSEFKNGAQTQLKLSSTSFSSGSEITSSEYLPLRVIWHKYLDIEDLKSMMVDDPKTGYRGYVSTENLAAASRIFDDNRYKWQSYLKEVSIREDEWIRHARTHSAWVSHGMAVPSQPLGSSSECGSFASALYWQLLSMTRDIDKETTADEIRRTSSISKPESALDLEPHTMPTPPAVNRPMTPFKSMLNDPTEQDTPIFGIHHTPQATSYHPAIGGQVNKPATDEYYVNTGLLDFLHGIKLSVGVEFSSLDWLAKRLPLKLKKNTLSKNPETGKIEMLMTELMEARLDGYLCRRPSAFEDKVNTEPLAILEVKPYTRSSALASIRRQEGAEMACWISQDGDSKVGLLRSSTSLRKRRLMISQDRHEIYIIIGEYGAGYEEHVRPSSSDVRGSAKPNRKTGQPGGSTTKSHADDDSTGNRRDPDLLAGSPSYIKRVEKKSISVEDKPRSCMAQPTQAALATRKSSRTKEKNALDVGDFLIMHEFGPFNTRDHVHMFVLIKRIIALMLELRGPQDRYVPERPSPDFLIQDDPFPPSAPNESRSSPAQALPISRSWPGQVEKTVPKNVVVSAKAEWRG